MAHWGPVPTNFLPPTHPSPITPSFSGPTVPWRRPRISKFFPCRVKFNNDNRVEVWCLVGRSAGALQALKPQEQKGFTSSLLLLNLKIGTFRNTAFPQENEAFHGYKKCRIAAALKPEGSAMVPSHQHQLCKLHSEADAHHRPFPYTEANCRKSMGCIHRHFCCHLKQLSRDGVTSQRLIQPPNPLLLNPAVIQSRIAWDSAAFRPKNWGFGHGRPGAKWYVMASEPFVVFMSILWGRRWQESRLADLGANATHWGFHQDPGRPDLIEFSLDSIEFFLNFTELSLNSHWISLNSHWIFSDVALFDALGLDILLGKRKGSRPHFWGGRRRSLSVGTLHTSGRVHPTKNCDKTQINIH